MRALVIAFAVVAVLSVVSAYPPSFARIPYEDLVDEGSIDVLFDVPQTHTRQKRATCDLLSAFGVGHAACAVHCIGHGYRGGWCNSRAVCNCRR
ncbi:defensin-like [Phlebotomus argentipes]|uniref:defensin-like n=1 Tax=Phlebotomus argentipes TaxID=94469 RepID=UPI002892F2DA|nr:defensin-like [Phlebotomus argentipes]